MELTAVIDQKVWIPITREREALAKEMYIHHRYEEASCKRCEFKEERPSDACSECASYLGSVQLYAKRKINGKSHIGVPKGNRVKLRSLIGKKTLIVDDLRPAPKMRYKLEFVGQLRPHQIEPIEQVIKARYGVLKAPPRAGKTVMAVAIACKLGLKTLIIAGQSEWLDEFERTFSGNETNEPMSNAPDIEKFMGRRIVGRCSRIEDFEKYDVALATYQTFLSAKGKKLLKQVNDLFGLVIIDEVHEGAANGYAGVLASLKAKYIFGLTGTDDRKDGMYKIVEDIIGPVTATAKVVTLVPTVRIIDTKTTTSYNYKGWTAAMQFLASHEKRNKLIASYAVKDIKNGRSIVIPVLFVAHAEQLAKLINLEFDTPVAEVFSGVNKVKNRKILERARSGETLCIVGIRKKTQTGINVPRWDTLFEVMPISNKPKAEQETSRIRTDVPGKQPPLIRVFTESFPQSRMCLPTLYWKTFVMNKFKMSPETKSAFKQFFGAGRHDPFNEPKLKFDFVV